MKKVLHSWSLHTFFWTQTSLGLRIAKICWIAHTNAKKKLKCEFGRDDALIGKSQNHKAQAESQTTTNLVSQWTMELDRPPPTRTMTQLWIVLEMPHPPPQKKLRMLPAGTYFLHQTLVFGCSRVKFPGKSRWNTSLQQWREISMGIACCTAHTVCPHKPLLTPLPTITWATKTVVGKKWFSLEQVVRWTRWRIIIVSGPYTHELTLLFFLRVSHISTATICNTERYMDQITRAYMDHI